MVGLAVAQSPQIEFAPRKKLRFQKQLEPLLLRILRQPEALVSDESMLWDFCVNDSDDAIGPGTKWASYLFKRKFYRGNVLDAFKDDSHWQEVTFETRAVPFRKMTIRRVLRHTGVDITPVFDEYFPVILQYIATRLAPERRVSLFGHRSKKSGSVVGFK
jgi:hypothetical protein